MTTTSGDQAELTAAELNSFYPQRLKGRVLGLNAGGGNIGVAVVQLIGLAVLATAGKDSRTGSGRARDVLELRPHGGSRRRRAHRVRAQSLGLFFAGFIALFALSGLATARRTR